MSSPQLCDKSERIDLCFVSQVHIFKLTEMNNNLIDVASFIDKDGNLASYEGEPEKIVFDALPEVSLRCLYLLILFRRLFLLQML